MKDLVADAARLPGSLPAWHATSADLRGVAEKARARKARLVALWASDERARGSGFALLVAFGSKEGLLWLTAPLDRDQPRYPGIADLFPAANRMQRAAYDLVGVHADGGADHRKWLRHGAWAAGTFPLRKDFAPNPENTVITVLNAITRSSQGEKFLM